MTDRERRINERKAKNKTYQEIQDSINSDYELNVNTWNKQPLHNDKNNFKRVMASVLAGTIMVGGIAGTSCSISKKNQSDNSYVSSVDDQNEDNMSNNESAQENLEYVLNEEFYVNEQEVKKANEDGNKNVVTLNKVIEDINKNLDISSITNDIKKGTKREQKNDVNIKNVINYNNNNIKRSDYSSNNATDIFYETQTFLLAPYSMFFQNNESYATARSYVLNGNYYNKEFSNKKIITPGAILESKGVAKEYNIAFAKSLNEQISDIIKYNEEVKKIQTQIFSLRESAENKDNEIKALENEISNLINSINAEFDENTKVFYELFEKVDADKKLNDVQKLIYYNYIKAVSSDYNLSTKQLEKINKELQSLLGNSHLFDVIKGFLTSEEYADVIALSEKDGCFARPITAIEENYKSSDVKEAGEFAGTPKDSNKKDITKNGNQSSGIVGKQEQIKTPTMRKETKTKTEKVPESEKKNIENGKKVTGGKVVDKKTEVHEQEIISDEVVQPGKEETPSVDAKTPSKDEEIYDDNVLYGDADDYEGVYSEEDFQKVLNNR